MNELIPVITPPIIKGTIDILLWSIKKNGLERTLEELRTAFGENIEVEDERGQGVWQGLLTVLREYQEMMK